MSHSRIIAGLIATIVLLALASVFVGAGALTVGTLAAGGLDADGLRLLLVSRIPRTLAALLAGAGLAVAGLIMQMLSSNRFVEPSTVGTTESASLGLLAVTILAPGLPVFGQMLIAAGFALAGTALFMAIIARLRLRSGMLVPLVGLIMSGIIGAGASFLAYRFDLMQSLGAWMSGDFSMVLRGRYELLWIAFGLTILAVFAADRFTLAGLGRDVATNLGLSYERVLALGLVVVSLVAAVTIVSVGSIPFVGLVVPNLVSMLVGDNGRRTVPYVALLGAALVLACDLVGRLVRTPYEIPAGTIMGVLGTCVFLAIIFRRRPSLG
ncbi:putative ABC-type siderophore permease protein [Aurantimonas manganoxydans SI85-9A1]|uniref:Putative ABC-type siderophore permease protein n=1 Tax=Aurantimonas manganoxydans (strain ATCC BAA-1229 / DSM 21871 / SI85-9A1) TaxID=287752 RepID=Q1YL93_AURMS|nr:iron chelate uptake ABC transporter family permease subunit [Aurantimonas manganoxydans]EAS51838.1 putative ABC-type siderophore permease protein [Aurantimonas manganoxydans SI85-9A1]